MWNFLEYGQKLHQKFEFFTNFQKCLEEKDQNIHLNDKFPLKIANIPKAKFPGNEIPIFRIFSMHFKF